MPSPEPHLSLDMLGDARIFTSPFIRDGSMLVISGYHDRQLGPFRCKEIPQDVEDIAVDIVHTGLADIVSWLREAGHKIPTWQQRRTVRQRERVRWSFESEARLSLSVMPPTSVVKIVNV